MFIMLAFSLFSIGFIGSSYVRYYQEKPSVLVTSSISNRNKQNINDNFTDNDKHNNQYIKRKSNITRIALLGERNSGTNWLTDELTKCFAPIPLVNVTPSLTRWKHWFQEDIDTEYTRSVNGESYRRQVKDDENSEVTTLVIAEFRNVYDWVESMRNRPHNMPSHMNQDWYSFLSTPWSMPRPERDLTLWNSKGKYVQLGDSNSSETSVMKRICQSDFAYNQVISCVKGTVPQKRKKHQGKNHYHRILRSEYEPIYELRNDGSGLAYGNILEMRRDKIRNHLSVGKWKWVENRVISVQYERLLVEGTGWLLDEISSLTGLKPQCNVTAPQPERLSHYPKEPGFVEWVGEHVDWETEALIGYTRWE